MKILNTLLSDIKIYNKIKCSFTYHSSHIEGSTVSEEDNKKIVTLNEHVEHEELVKLTNHKYEDDEVQENYNYGELFDYAIKTINEPLTIRELHIWHNILKRDTIWSQRNINSYGKFKSIPNKVGGYDTPQPHEINVLMNQYINRWNKKKLSLIEISHSHCEFESIHPFLDGNGRIGRLIMLKQCLLSNEPLLIITDDNRNEYINSLAMYRKTNNFKPLHTFLSSLQSIFRNEYSRFFQYDIFDKQWQIIEKWFKANEIINRRNVEKLFNVKSSGAKKILNKFIGKKLLISIKIGPKTYYVKT